MMEQVQEKKFICKFCNKYCFSGKSLGGHMRCHLALISASRKEKLKTDIKMGFGEGNDDGDDRDDYGLVKDSKNSCGVSAEQSNSDLNQVEVEIHSSMNIGSDDQDRYQDQDSYGLREHPKKSWKADDVGASPAPRKGNLCKECGKKFPSSRALAGHMRAHSGKSKDRHLCVTCGKGFDSLRAMFGHMKTHSKRSRVSSDSAYGLSELDIVYPRKKRSVMRYKFSQTFSFSSANESSSVDEFDEAENAAMCLMMLSRGVTNQEESNCPLDYTDNATSVDFEAKSFPYRKGMTVDGDNFVCNPDEVDKGKKPIKELDPLLSVSGNSLSKQNVSDLNDSGSQLATGNGKEVEPEVCLDEHFCSGESKKSRQVDISDIELDEPKIKRASDSAGVELLKDQTKLQLVDPISEFEENSSDAAKCDDKAVGIFKDSEKKREYKCRICNVIFQSYQALGGHSNRHKVLGNYSTLSTETSRLSDTECNDSSTETKTDGITIADLEFTTKRKDHECPICFKVFPTGQALGGHKRAHYVAFTDSRIQETTIVTVSQELDDVQSVFNLNIPAITHQVSRNGEVGIKKWWVGSDHGPEPLLISN